MPQEPLQIEKLSTSNADRSILCLTGPILINNLFEFQSTVRSDPARMMILDFTGVPYIDSAGVGCLVGAYVSRQKDGRSLGLVGVCDRVRNTLKITQVEGFFRYFDSLADAEKAVA